MSDSIVKGMLNVEQFNIEQRFKSQHAKIEKLRLLLDELYKISSGMWARNGNIQQFDGVLDENLCLLMSIIKGGIEELKPVETPPLGKINKESQ